MRTPGKVHAPVIAALPQPVIPQATVGPALDDIRADERQAIPLLRDINELYRIKRPAWLTDLAHEEGGLPHMLGRISPRMTKKCADQNLRHLHHSMGPYKLRENPFRKVE